VQPSLLAGYVCVCVCVCACVGKGQRGPPGTIGRAGKPVSLDYKCCSATLNFYAFILPAFFLLCCGLLCNVICINPTFRSVPPKSGSPWSKWRERGSRTKGDFRKKGISRTNGTPGTAWTPGKEWQAGENVYSVITVHVDKQ